MTETKDGHSQTSLLDPATGRERPFRRAPGTWLPLGPVPDRTGAQTAWVVRFYDARTPMRVLHLVGQGETTDLTPLPPGHGIPPELLTAPEDFRWRSVDGLAIHGWLYRATQPSKGLIVWVHGGPTWHLEARYDLAVAQFAAGEREAAIDQLLAIFKANRGWNDEAARKQLVKFFEAMGPTDPMTLAGRRKLSSLMFS